MTHGGQYATDKKYDEQSNCYDWGVAYRSNNYRHMAVIGRYEDGRYVAEACCRDNRSRNRSQHLVYGIPDVIDNRNFICDEAYNGEHSERDDTPILCDEREVRVHVEQMQPAVSN